LTKQAEAVAHNELVGGSQTSLHSHPGGGGGLIDKSGQVTSDGNGVATVTFNTPYGHTNYFIQLTCVSNPDSVYAMVATGTKASGGFTVVTDDDSGKSESDVIVDWCTGSYSNP
jgi:hypothetical protein